jgi:hypothetical protein
MVWEPLAAVGEAGRKICCSRTSFWYLSSTVRCKSLKSKEQPEAGQSGSYYSRRDGDWREQEETRKGDNPYRMGISLMFIGNEARSEWKCANLDRLQRWTQRCNKQKKRDSIYRKEEANESADDCCVASAPTTTSWSGPWLTGAWSEIASV